MCKHGITCLELEATSREKPYPVAPRVLVMSNDRYFHWNSEVHSLLVDITPEDMVQDLSFLS